MLVDEKARSAAVSAPVQRGQSRARAGSNEADILSIVGNALGAMARSGGSCDAFCGPKEPRILVGDFLKRLLRYIRVWRGSGSTGPVGSEELWPLVYSLFIVDKLSKKSEGFVLNRMNVHRVLLVSFLLAIKQNEDKPVSNTFWAQVGGIPVSELNAMELKLLSMVGFSLAVSATEFVRFEALLHSLV